MAAVLAIILIGVTFWALTDKVQAARAVRSGGRSGSRASSRTGGTRTGPSPGGSRAAGTRYADGMLSRWQGHRHKVSEIKWTDWIEDRRWHRRHTTPQTRTVPGTVVPPEPPGQPRRQAPQPQDPAGPAPEQARPAPAPPAPAPQPDGSTPQPSPNPQPTGGTVSTGAVEQAIEGVHGIDTSARAGNIHAKHAAIKAFAELSVRFSQTLGMLATALAEPGSNYGPEITEPLAKAAEFQQASALALGESDAGLASLKGMTVGELADSARQAPHHAELTETGSR